MKRKHQVTLLSLITAVGIALMPSAVVKVKSKLLCKIILPV